MCLQLTRLDFWFFCTTLKFNMEPENEPWKKRVRTWKPSFSGSTLNFGGCIHYNSISFLWRKTWSAQNPSKRDHKTRWWFQIFFIFTPICGRFSFWLIFFKWVETTNHKRMYLNIRRRNFQLPTSKKATTRFHRFTVFFVWVLDGMCDQGALLVCGSKKMTTIHKAMRRYKMGPLRSL